MAERFNAAVLKTVEGVSLPGVQIPLSPPQEKITNPHDTPKGAWGLVFFASVRII